MVSLQDWFGRSYNFFHCFDPQPPPSPSYPFFTFPPALTLYSEPHAPSHPPLNSHPSPPPLQANEFLLLNQKLTAQEAFDRNLVTRVFPASEFDSRVEELVKYMAQLPPQVQHTTCVCSFTSFNCFVCNS